MTATPETAPTTTDSQAHLTLAGLAQQAGYAFRFAKAGHTVEAIEHLDAIERLATAYREALSSPSQERDGRLERGRNQLIEAMSGVSEERYCAGWMGDWARILHAEGGIWETLGRDVGWPTGNYDQWVWVSWDQAGRLYAQADGGGK